MILNQKRGKNAERPLKEKMQAHASEINMVVKQNDL